MPKPNPRGEAFACLLRDARQHEGLTQDQVVDRSGISRSTYLRWEAGDAHRPGPEEVRAVCDVLNIHPIHAAISLGYLQPGDLTANPPQTPPEEAEFIAMLRDPRIPALAKDALRGYLRAMREQADQNPQTRGNGRKAG